MIATVFLTEALPIVCKKIGEREPAGTQKSVMIRSPISAGYHPALALALGGLVELSTRARIIESERVLLFLMSSLQHRSTEWVRLLP